MLVSFAVGVGVVCRAAGGGRRLFVWLQVGEQFWGGGVPGIPGEGDEASSCACNMGRHQCMAA